MSWFRAKVLASHAPPQQRSMALHSEPRIWFWFVAWKRFKVWNACLSWFHHISFVFHSCLWAGMSRMFCRRAHISRGQISGSSKNLVQEVGKSSRCSLCCLAMCVYWKYLEVMLQTMCFRRLADRTSFQVIFGGSVHTVSPSEDLFLDFQVQKAWRNLDLLTGVRGVSRKQKHAEAAY